MDCPNCGTNLDISSGNEYVKCQYCRSVIAVMVHTTELLSDAIGSLSEDNKTTIKQLLKLGSIEMDGQDYQKAYATFERILNLHPFAWEAMINQAICVFWLGREDMGHLDEVNALLTKAEKLSNSNPSVVRARKDIAYNLALLASTKERLGENINWSIACFKISKSIILTVPERDTLIVQYANSLHSEINRRLENGVMRDKKEFDPPLTELNTLFDLIILANDRITDCLKTYIIYAGLKLNRHSSDSTLLDNMHTAKTRYLEFFPNQTLPAITFNFFGKPVLP